MAQDNRLSRLVHVLLHLTEKDGPKTSERIAQMVGSHPALVRRMMGGLRECGIVTSSKGHGGGWMLSRPLDEITLLDVYRGIGSPGLFAFGLSDPAPRCLIEQTVNEALNDAMEDASRRLLDHFARVTLSEIDDEFHQRLERSTR